MNKPCVIFDLDGTLSDDKHRLHFLRATPKRWDDYYAACHADPPIVHNIELCRAIAKALPVIILTGRIQEQQHNTAIWLQRHVVPYELLLMRPNNDFRNAVLLKHEMLISVRKRNYEPLFAVDDAPHVIEYWRASGIPCIDVGTGEWIT